MKINHPAFQINSLLKMISTHFLENYMYFAELKIKNDHMIDKMEDSETCRQQVRPEDNCETKADGGIVSCIK